MLTVLLLPGSDRVRHAQATFVAALPSDLMWLDQSDLLAAIEENPEIRACLEKTAIIGQDVSMRAACVMCMLP